MPHHTSPHTTTRVASYTSGRDYDTACRRQEALLGHLAARPDWQRAGTYVGIRPHGKGERFALRRAIADAQAGRFDVLLVAGVYSLTRDTRRLAAILSDLDTAGVALCSPTDRVDTSTASGRMAARLLIVLANVEPETRRFPPPSSPRGTHRPQRRTRPQRGGDQPGAAPAPD